VASGSSFVALACDAAGDDRSAAARAQGDARGDAPVRAAADPRPRPPAALPEHAADLQAALADVDGRVVPERVLGAASAAVGADLLGAAARPRLAGAHGGARTYLGSYTGVLLASTAVPVWARSRTTLPPIFVCTAAAGGRRAQPLVAGRGGARAAPDARGARHRRDRRDGRRAGAVRRVNERRLGTSRARWRRAARAAVHASPVGGAGGLALRFSPRRGRDRPRRERALPARRAGVPLRLGRRGKASARDDEAVARMARS
jgi:hypothetical protein